jgi:DNA-binding protein YbaB
MLGLTDGQWGALGVGIGILSSLVTAAFSWVSKNAKRAHELEMKNLTDRMDRAEKSQELSWKKVDELREKYWSRDEQSRFRDEIKSDMKALEDRVITAIRDTTNQIRADIRERRREEGQ